MARVVPRHIDRSAALTDDLRRIAAVAAADVRRTEADPRDIGTNDPSPAGF